MNSLRLLRASWPFYKRCELYDHVGPELGALLLETGEKWKVVAGDKADEGGGCESGATYRGALDNRHVSARDNVQM